MEGREMKACIRWVLMIAVGVASTLGIAQAGEPLSKQQVASLLSGSKATQRSTDPSEHGSGLFEFAADGRVTNTHTGTKFRGVVETGTWRVSDKGQLCITWQGKAEEKCRYVVPLGGGAYDLTENPAKSGKFHFTAVSK
jgi:hypothetical protein